MGAQNKGGGRYIFFFCAISVVFISLLLVVYRITRQANPIMLDEHGHVVSGH